METAVRGDSESDSFRFPSLMVAYSILAPLIVTSKKVKISSFFSGTALSQCVVRGEQCTCGTVGNKAGIRKINKYVLGTYYNFQHFWEVLLEKNILHSMSANQQIMPSTTKAIFGSTSVDGESNNHVLDCLAQYYFAVTVFQ